MLCQDPSMANPVRTLSDDITPTVYRYQDREYFVAFDLPDDATLRVWMFGKGAGQTLARSTHTAPIGSGHQCLSVHA